MSGRRRRKLKWTEPICFNRRKTIRSLAKLRGPFVRMTLFGLGAAAVVHFIIHHYNLPFTRSIWWIYPFAIGIVPILIFVTLTGFILPRNVRIDARYVTIQDGNTAGRIEFADINRYRIGVVRSSPHLAYLAIERCSSGDKRQIHMLGVPPKVDVLELDRTLRARQRLWKKKRRS